MAGSRPGTVKAHPIVPLVSQNKETAKLEPVEVFLEHQALSEKPSSVLTLDPWWEEVYQILLGVEARAARNSLWPEVAEPPFLEASQRLAESADWKPLLATTPRGNCGGCGLPRSAVSCAYRIPGNRDWFCSIGCIECVLFGARRCRWCGMELNGRSDQRFCDEQCAAHYSRTRLSNGERLLHWLAYNEPRLYEAITHRSSVGTCRNCGGILEGKRSHAVFCSASCKMAFRRLMAIRQ